ncbi:unnamed protein product [Allacma fusca]|uniref:Uncharacterized protein n=1 Tax=Allacma fusca TaxID=39272 RepID=A0A8J2LN40_9HEXA|nr:unnamed protein product [Allacma fusca]
MHILSLHWGTLRPDLLNQSFARPASSLSVGIETAWESYVRIKPIPWENPELTLFNWMVIFGGQTGSVFCGVKSNKVYRISSLLQDVVEFLNTLDSTLNRAEKLAQEDPYKDLIDQVKPAYEKIASIKKQTEIYEKMQRIPGGPTNFMSTALEALESIARLIPVFERQYRLIVAGKKKEIGLLQDDYKKSLQGLDSVFEDRTLDELEKIGVYMNDPSETFIDFKNVGLETIKEKVLHLANQFATLEKLQQQQSSLMENSPEGEIDEGLEEEITSFIQEVAGTISRDEQFFRLIMPKIGEKWKHIEGAVSKIGEHQSHVKTRYEKLGDQLDADVIRTRERINALKYPKKNDEL